MNRRDFLGGLAASPFITLPTFKLKEYKEEFPYYMTCCLEKLAKHHYCDSQTFLINGEYMVPMFQAHNRSLWECQLECMLAASIQQGAVIVPQEELHDWQKEQKDKKFFYHPFLLDKGSEYYKYVTDCLHYPIQNDIDRLRIMIGSTNEIHTVSGPNDRMGVLVYDHDIKLIKVRG